MFLCQNIIYLQTTYLVVEVSTENFKDSQMFCFTGNVLAYNLQKIIIYKRYVKIYKRFSTGTTMVIKIRARDESLRLFKEKIEPSTNPVKTQNGPLLLSIVVITWVRPSMCHDVMFDYKQ